MPYTIIKDGKDWWVVKKTGKKKMHKNPHKSQSEAIKHKVALDHAEKRKKR